MTVAALVATILLGTACLAWGYLSVGLEPIARWLAVFGAIWLLAVWRRWQWYSYLGLAAYFAFAALGLWFLDFSPGWMFAGAILALLAWDLTHFRYRQRFAASDGERRSVELRHLLRLSLLALLGFTIASLAMLVRLEFTFAWTAFMVLVVALSLSQVIRWFRGRR
jgi:hypothetical protein